MKEIHCHILPTIDDGSKSLEMSYEILKSAKEAGINDIILTPHYVEMSKYVSNRENNLKVLNELKEFTKEIDINLYLGNEVYINYNILELLEKGEISTLNNSRYMLIELPLNSKFNNTKSVFIELINHGITPILAHPERYTEYQNDIDFFFELRELGVLMQINYPSLLGHYGTCAKKQAKRLLKANLISFVGSDTHRDIEAYKSVNKAIKKLTKIVGYEKMLDYTERNILKIINNEEIS